MNQGTSLLRSKQFWTMLVSILVALALHFAAKYLPESLEDVQTVIDLVLPLALFLIAAFTTVDVATVFAEAQVQMHAASGHELTEQLRAAAIVAAADRK